MRWTSWPGSIPCSPTWSTSSSSAGSRSPRSRRCAASQSGRCNGTGRRRGSTFTRPSRMRIRLSDDRWRAVIPHLDRALELAEDERAGWLAALRADDASLAEDVEALLAKRHALDEEGFLSEAPAPGSWSSLAGHVIGAYTLRAQIGQGGMGSVWLAERSDGRYQGVAAVKLLNASLVGEGGEARFRR